MLLKYNHPKNNNSRNVILIIFSLVISACQPTSNQPIKRWQHAIEGAYAANISNDGHYSVISSIHHGISLWDLKKNALKYNWSQQQNSSDNLVLTLDISNNNSHVLSASRTDFALWNIKTGQSEGYWKVRNSTIRDIALSNYAAHLLIGKSSGDIVHVTMSNGRRLEFLGHTEKINSLDMLPNGRVVISGGNDFIAYVWDTVTGQVIYKFDHPSRVSKVALDAYGRYAFSADSMNGAHIWDLKTGKLISDLIGLKRQEIFTSVNFSQDGKTMLTGAATKKVSVWDVATGKRLSHWQVSPKESKRPTGTVVYSVAFGDNGNILTESSSGYAELWQTPQ
jgi:WD40 repeat protein